GERLFAQYLEADAARRACAIMRDSGLQPLVWEDNYPDPPDIIASAECTGFTKEYLGRHEDFVMYVAEPFRFDSPRIAEVGAWSGFDELNPVSETIGKELGDSVRVHIAKDIIGDYSILEVMSPRAGKWNAVRHLARTRGIAREEIVAVGDNYNDIELVGNAGFGVAMGNAVEAVKEVAAHITSSNDEEGLYNALKKAFEKAH
ncbi:MAG: HAD hydrolase family protein, partial [Planctomycetota bacterium]